jgi:hypothetical protein
LPDGSGKVNLDGDGSSGGVSVSDGLVDIRTGTGSRSQVKFYCEVSNAHAQTIQPQPHSASVTNTLTLPAGGNQELVGTTATQTLTNKSIDASQLTGTIADARFPATLPAISGANLTNLPVTTSASDLTSGTLPDARFPAVLPAISGANLTNLPAQSFASLTSKPTTIAGYGITDAFDGAYGSLTGTPTIPTNNNQLTNGAGYITSVPAQSFASLTGKPTTIAGYGITDVVSEFTAGTGISIAANGTIANTIPATTSASDLTSGTLADARFPATLPAISGANLTNLPSPTPHTESVGSISGSTLNLASGNIFSHAPSSNTTYVFSSPPASGTAIGFTLKVSPSATVTLTWPSSVDWPGGVAPTAPASGETDVFTFYTQDGGTTYYGFQAGNAMA